MAESAGASTSGDIDKLASPTSRDVLSSGSVGGEDDTQSLLTHQSPGDDTEEDSNSNYVQTGR